MSNWNVLGDLILEYVGLKDHLWKYFGTFGYLESEGNYVSGQQGGNWVFYYSGKNFDKDHSIKSSEGTLIGKEKVGVWKFYKRNGSLDYKWDFNKFPERN